MPTLLRTQHPEFLLAGLALAGLAGCAGPTPRPPPPPVLVAPAPPPPTVREAAEPPVYRNPRIAAVYLRAHVDAEGRLLGPQVMYQVADPGGWNIDALDPDHASAPPAADPTPAPARQPDSPLLDPANAARIRFTGLMSEADRDEARTQAGRAEPGTQAVYDREAGWLLVPPPDPPG